MTPAKTADTEKVPIEKIDSATRAPQPLEQEAAERAAADARAAGSNPGLPFLPPGDVPGHLADPNAPTPPPYFNTYSFTVFLKANPAWVAFLGLAANPGGENVRVVAPNVQAAYNAVIAQYGANLLKVLGPCPVFVGADATMSGAAGAAAPMQAKPLHADSTKKDSQKDSQKENQTTPRKAHSSWD